ncbi:ankyrin repeat domain-containing protein [Salmonella enterica subsp. enterica]|nr:ankyrin repeat domain-containing protein [Salmonella enterica subsp. enterica serovar Glostrup]
MTDTLANIFLDNGLTNIQDKYGRTPIFYSNDYILTTSLISAGANIHHIDKFGRTPFFYYWLYNPLIIELFIELGIDIDHKDNYGLTFISYELGGWDINLFLKHIKLVKERCLTLNEITYNTINLMHTLNEYGFDFIVPTLVRVKIPQHERKSSLIKFNEIINNRKIDITNTKFILKDSEKIAKIIIGNDFLNLNLSKG